MRWRAFYADGHEVTSADAAWSELPRHELVIAVWWDRFDQRHLDCGADALIHTGNAIVSVNLPSTAFERAAALEATSGRLKYGVRMDPEAWAAIRARADSPEARIPPE